MVWTVFLWVRVRPFDTSVKIVPRFQGPAYVYVLCSETPCLPQPCIHSLTIFSAFGKDSQEPSAAALQPLGRASGSRTPWVCCTSEPSSHTFAVGDQPLCNIPIENILAVERLEEESFRMKNVSDGSFQPDRRSLLFLVLLSCCPCPLPDYPAYPGPGTLPSGHSYIPPPSLPGPVVEPTRS